MRTPASTETLLREDVPCNGGKPGWAVEGQGEILRRSLKYILKFFPKERGKPWLTGTSGLGGSGIKVWGQS